MHPLTWSSSGGSHSASSRACTRLGTWGLMVSGQHLPPLGSSSLKLKVSTCAPTCGLSSGSCHSSSTGQSPKRWHCTQDCFPPGLSLPSPSYSTQDGCQMPPWTVPGPSRLSLVRPNGSRHQLKPGCGLLVLPASLPCSPDRKQAQNGDRTRSWRLNTCLILYQRAAE